MKRTTSTAIGIIFASIGSMGAFCTPSNQSTAQPTPQIDNSGVYSQLLTQQYEAIDPTIEEYFDKIEIQEAEYQDWHGRVDESKKQKATYGTVEKQHVKLLQRTEDAQTEYDEWRAFYEEHKSTGSAEAQGTLSTDGQALQQITLKIFSDYGQLKTTMSRIAPLHEM